MRRSSTASQSFTHRHCSLRVQMKRFFGAAGGFGFADVGGTVAHAKPANRAAEVTGPVLESPIVSQLDPSSDIEHPDCGPGLSGQVIDVDKHPHPPVVSCPGHGGVGAPPHVRPIRNDGAVMRTAGPRSVTRCGASRPSRRISRRTRLPLTFTSCSRRSQARTLR